MCEEGETNLVISPCCHPEFTLGEALRTYHSLGFRKFELFTGWVKSAVSVRDDPLPIRRLADSVGMRFSSFHLPPVTGRNFEDSFRRAVQAARFARALGVSHVIFKADAKPVYIRSARQFLDAIENLGLTPVLQNHAGTAISSLDDYRKVLEGIGDDRMGTILEVGHFHAVGVPWEEGYALLRDRLALVHLKDMRGSQSVAFGTGEIDLKRLFNTLHADGYRGDFVVEMEVEDHENCLDYLAEAREYVLEMKGVMA